MIGPLTTASVAPQIVRISPPEIYGSYSDSADSTRTNGMDSSSPKRHLGARLEVL